MYGLWKIRNGFFLGENNKSRRLMKLFRSSGSLNICITNYRIINLFRLKFIIEFIEVHLKINEE